jgi:hypothetical protein
MKRIALLLLLIACLVVPGSAYLINFDSPDTLTAGEPLVLDGSSTLPPGFSTDVVFYKAGREIARETITIQGDRSWSATFETTGLAQGQYKLEIEEKSIWVDNTYISYDYGSGSDTQKIIQIIDRSDEISLTSPAVQTMSGTLMIAGRGETLGSNGVEITVQGPSGPVFGPRYIPTDANGRFSEDVPISESGTYSIRFADAAGYITTMTVTVTNAAATPTPEPETPGLQASAQASRESPAYFAVDTRPGDLILTTSTGIDWVVEYIDEAGNLVKVNQKGTTSPETATIPVEGGQVYVKVYPFKYTDTGTVTLSAQNADAVTVSSDAASLFGDEPPATPTPESPLPAAIALGALFILGIGRRLQ